MRKAFLYPIYPTKAQATKLAQALEECRWTYNPLLEQRQVYWDEFGISVGYYDQKAYLPILKGDRPTLAAVHSQVLQNVSERVDLAFKAFFRRVKAGEDPGYPRFRGRGRYNSITYPQYGSGRGPGGRADGAEPLSGQEHSGRGVDRVSRLSGVQGSMGRSSVCRREPRVHQPGLFPRWAPPENAPVRCNCPAAPAGRRRSVGRALGAGGAGAAFV